MNENDEIEIYTLSDEEGNEHEFQLLATHEQNGVTYYAMMPADDADKDEEYCEYVILKEVEENGERTLVSIDDDDEFADVAGYFDDLFEADEIDYDAPENK